MEYSKLLPEGKKDSFCLIAILSILFFRFFNVLVLSRSISKLFLLAHWDSAFYPLKAGNNLSMDPSLLEQAIPMRFFVSEFWHHGFPLWNQYSGVGMPLLADPQAFVFSATGFLFTLCPGIHTWEILLILKLAIGALSTYLLCRQFELTATGSLVAALLFAFCPWTQWELELLGKGICFVPLVILFFVRLGKSNSFSDAALAGLIAGVDILTVHPEIAFITILSSTLILFLVAFYNDRSQFDFASLFFKIIVAGLVAFGITAPMLIPFGEYLINGESYKTTTVASIGLAAQAVFSNYLFPFVNAGSLFFGPLSWFGLAAIFCFANKSNRFVVPLVICLLMSLVAVIRFWPFNFLFAIPPFSMAFATYCLPEYILFVSIISGLGVSWLLENVFKAQRDANKRTRLGLVCGIALILCTMPFFLNILHLNNVQIDFDKTFAPPHFVGKKWCLIYCFTAIMVGEIWVMAFSGFFRVKKLATLLFLVLGIGSLLIVAYASLPLAPAFSYPQSLPINIERDSDSRIISIGDHVLKPGTNLIYKLPMIQTLNPLVPKGFLEFVKACGAQVTQYTQIFPPVISRLLNLAGVQTIVSAQPILDETVAANISTGKGASLEYADGLKIDKIQILYEPKSKAVFCHARIAVIDLQNNYHICLGLEDLDGKSVSFIEPVSITMPELNEDIYASGLLPQNIKHWQIVLRVLKDKDCSFIRPTSIPFGSLRADNSWLLCTDNESQRYIVTNNSRFELVSNSSGVLVYKDKLALPRRFFVKRITWANEPDQALNYIQAHTNELEDLVVLDTRQNKQFTDQLSKIQPDAIIENDKRSITFDNSGNIKCLPPEALHGFELFPSYSMQTQTLNPALLFISDLYYPGWKVYLDGKRWKLFRADYIFQAILVPAGKHLVQVTFQPVSFIIGLFLFAFTVASVLLFFLSRTYGRPIGAGKRQTD